MGLVAIRVGLDLKHLTRALYTLFVIMALLTTAMAGPSATSGCRRPCA